MVYFIIHVKMCVSVNVIELFSGEIGLLNQLLMESALGMDKTSK